MDPACNPVLFLAFYNEAVETNAAATELRPDAASGLAIWLSADALSASNGQTITTWADRSAAGNNFTQNTCPGAPAYATNRVGGLPALQFVAASSQCLESAAIPALDVAQISWFIVARSDNPTLTQVFTRTSYASGGSAQSNNFWGSFTEADNLFNHTRQVNGIIVAAAGAVGTEFFYTTGIWNGSRLDAFLNGAQIGFTSQANTTPVGHQATRAGASPTAFFLDGEMAEFIVYARALDDVERRGVELYLARKYGFAGQ